MQITNFILAMESLNLRQHHTHDDDGVKSTLIFLGTGCSSTVPSGMCLIQPSDPPCAVCAQALSFPPEHNPNYRCNTSLLIDYYRPSDEKHSYVLIDIGKTFREQVLRWFTFHKIPRVDSIILTHEHADAVLGFDDIRAVLPYSNDIDPIPIYLTQFTMDSVASRFPYLINKKVTEAQRIRQVASLLDWKIIDGECQRPFIASAVQFVPLPVMHGEDYISLGFLFGVESKVAYISDISRLPESTEYAISRAGAGQLDLLILEASRKHGPPGGAHFTLAQALETVKRLCPKRALFTGMGHEFDHHKDNEFLVEWSKREGIPVQLAHDGLRVLGTADKLK